ncbi:MAG: hypothetical protein Q4G62_10280 [Pseudomonadota bacterium]|nr:hypothetical protein [Pseudomonadota bacterium]
MNKQLLIALSPLALALAACAPSSESKASSPATPAVDAANAAPADAEALAPVDVFMASIAAHCGKAYEGKIIANEPKPTTPDAFEGKRLVMHVRGCDTPKQRLEVPFHVGDDHSRTWILTRLDDGLRLKHDHRHEDGSPDAMTMYGGDSKSAGTAQRQEFPVDAESIAMFEKGGLNASVENTWAMEIHPQTFVYELARPNGRLFKVEFDLTKPVDLPPTPWGW